jgi:TonB family protein
MTSALHAATPTPEQQQLIQTNTFEVVVKKPEKDPATYEKPLPLELLPYLERNDAYQSVGTAFALGHNVYVTAAHVLVAAVDSQYGKPALRHSGDLASPTFEIDQVLKFSAYQDFVVFSVHEDPAPPGFSLNQEPKIDDPVMAVGNALGEGVVVRDGLYTSATAEQQDGRWKWIRFSAAASPGNSGGPLLDAQARVIGIVIGKSPNENLNYSLPIGQVMDAPDRKARFDDRELVSLPFLHGTQTYAFKDGFDLPLSWLEFSHRYQQIIEHHEQLSRDSLLKHYADTLFPSGEGTESILYSADANEFRPRMIKQQDDGRWNATSPDYTTTEFSGDGSVSVGNVDGALLLRLIRPEHASDDAFYGNSKAFMDLALKGLNLSRPVGTDRVRITSLGAAQSDMVYADHYGRQWQQRVWAVPFLDLYIECLLLPTPDGYNALIQYAPSVKRAAAQARNKLLVDQIDVSVTGTLAQWRAYLNRRASLPAAFDEVTLEATPLWQLKARRFAFSVPATLIPLSDQSVLSVTMGFIPVGTQAVWDLEDVWWYRDEARKAGMGLWRRLRPPASANQELRTTFNDMRGRHAPYDSSWNRESASTYSLSTIVEVPGTKAGMVSADLLYGLTMQTDKYDSLGDPVQFFGQLNSSAHITESGLGENLVPAQPLPEMTGDPFDLISEHMLKTADQSDQEFGADIRGRHFSADLKDMLGAARKQFALPGADPERLSIDLLSHARILISYWRQVPALTHNRDVWASFLAHNGWPVDKPHRSDIIAREQALKDSLSSGPTEASATLSQQLIQDYVKERAEVGWTRKLGDTDYVPRVSPCPPPATRTSGSGQVQTGAVNRTPDEFYPDASLREALEGRVVLYIRVADTGCAQGFAIAGSSGSTLLDEAAIRYAETMEFLPAEKDGKAIQAVKPLAVTFRLH